MRLPAEGLSAKGLGPIWRDGAVRRPLALGAWPAPSRARVSQQSSVGWSV